MSQKIQFGKALKNGDSTTVNFDQTFSETPTVVISPFYENQNQQVANVDTISDISKSAFTVVSGNQASNYYVNWIAISKGNN
ncbi:MAG: hypothetical protein ABUK01_19110 [Leptospirales bacterium]